MGKIRMTKYGHAIMMAVCGIFLTVYDSLLFSFLGGILIGFGLKLAYEAGQEAR